MNRLDTAIKATSYNVLLQVSLRASGFIMNAVVLRYIQAELLGVVNLRLTLLYNTILFVSREAIRKARLTKGNNTELWAHSLNISWIPVPLGMMSAIVLSLVWLNPYIEQPNIPGDGYGVFIFSLAAIIELCAEPMWLLGQEYQHVLLKVLAEGIPQLVKCTIVVIGVVLGSYSGLTVFLVAQLVYSLLYVLLYYVYFHRELQNPSSGIPAKRLSGLLPHRSSTQGYFGPTLPSLSWTFFKQSFLKQMLTDGEKYVMTVFNVLSFAQQGVYDTINNLGSLVARFIFLPIEESFYIYFSTTLYRGVPMSDQPEKLMKEASNALSMILKVVLVIAITIVTFGYSYSHLALEIYGGSLLVDGGGVSLLRWYCVYVLLLAVNGVTECFVFAIMSEKEVNRYNRTLMLFSAVFLGSTLFLSRYLGGVGFILANCVNMLTRIGHSCHFIRSYFSSSTSRPLLKALPSIPTMCTFIVMGLLAASSEKQFCCDKGWTSRFIHVGIGTVLFLAMGVVVGLKEPELFHFMGTKMNRLVGPGRRQKKS